MTRLYRPHIPVEVKCRVALRQLGEMWPDRVIAEHKGMLGDLLAAKLTGLAPLLGTYREDLRLDHDPPLGARPRRRVGRLTIYSPAANDPEHLFYRPNTVTIHGSHLVKTNVRGDHGQHPDRVLIVKQRRLEQGRGPKRPTVGLKKGRRKPERKKYRWAKRPMRGRR